MNQDDQAPDLGNVIAAALTPMHQDQTVNPEALADHCRRLLATGCDSILLMGSTGEANSLTVDERIQLLDRAVESGLPPEKLLVGTGCCALPDTLTLSKHALGCGVGGILILPPFYYKKVSGNGLLAAFRQIIDGLHHPSPNIYLYHFPQMTGVPFSDHFIRQIREEYPGALIGVKDSSGDFAHMQSLIKSFPGFRVYAGTETYLLDILKSGGPGAISATLNITSALAGQVADKWQTEEAETMQQKLSAVRKTFEVCPFVSGMKGLLAKTSGNTAWQNMRPPFVKLEEHAIKNLMNRLAQLNFTI